MQKLIGNAKAHLEYRHGGDIEGFNLGATASAPARYIPALKDGGFFRGSPVKCGG